MKNKWLILVVWLALPFALAAQGTISGTVIDEDLGETLIFASVYIESDPSSGTTTDFDGKYQLQVPAGTYTIVVSYVGYAEKRITDVVVKDGEVTYLDVSVSGDAIEMETIVVEAKVIERSENALLLLQRKSDKIQDGISAQEMSRYAVGDAAGAMKKVTGATVSGGRYIYIRGLGDRYSLSQLNGLIIPSTDPYRNSAQLDLIPTNLLENIITSKTFTPDQPGTFTGGNVDIRTKSFPEQFSLKVSVSGSFNAQNNLIDDFLSHEGGDTDYFGYDDGTRDRPAVLDDPATLGILNTQAPLLARLNFQGRGAEVGALADNAIRSTLNDFTPTEITTPIDHSVSISFGNQYQLFGKPLGVILAGAFSQTYSHLADYTKANWILEDIATGELFNQGDFMETLSTQTPTVNGMAGLAYKFNNYNTITFNTLYNHSTDKQTRFIFGERPDNIRDPEFLEGRELKFLERELINYQLGGRHVFPGIREAELEWKVSLANSSMAEPDTRFFENQYNAEFDVYSIPASNIQRPFHFWRDLEDEQQDFKLDFTLPISENKVNKIKVGGMVTLKERTFFEYRYQIEEHVGFTREFNTGNPDDYLADDNIGIISVNDAGDRPILGNYLVNRTELRNQYTGTDEVFAAYAMLTYQLTEKLKFVGGARLETTDIFVESRDTTLEAGLIDETNILPSFNLIYALTDEMNLRATYSQTLARPNMREIAPFQAFDPLTKEIFFGNTNLDKTDIQNVDLRWEWFMNPGEILAISAYYKNFNNPIAINYRRAPQPEIEFINVDQGELFGIELEFRKDLAFIGPLFNNFKFNGNFSYIDSRLDVLDLTGLEPDDRPFEGQSPFIFNAALLYTDTERGLDATLSLNVVGDRLDIIGREGTPDIYNIGRSQLDFNITKSIGNLDLKFTMLNITDSPYKRASEYLGDEYIYEEFRRGIFFRAGVAYTFR